MAWDSRDTDTARRANRLLVGLAEELRAPASAAVARELRGIARSIAVGQLLDDCAGVDECGPLGPAAEEVDEAQPGSGLPPLVWNAPKERQDLQRSRRRRPNVGFAQQLLNCFLAEVVRFSPEEMCPFNPAGVRALTKKIRVPLEVDCVFGEQTELATKAFQLCHGLADDGKIGPTTWRKLLAFRPARVTPAGGSGAGKKELTLVATFAQPSAWKSNVKEEIRLIQSGAWHPSDVDMLAVANTPNRRSAKDSTLIRRTKVLSITNVGDFLGAIISGNARGSIARLNITSHGGIGVIGLTGELLRNGKVRFLPSNRVEPLESKTLDDGILSLLNEEPLCKLRDQAISRFAPNAEIALILCNGGIGNLKFTLGRTFGVRVRFYKGEVFFKPDISGGKIGRRDLTAKSPSETFKPGYPCFVSVPAGLDGKHLAFDDQTKVFSPVSCITA